MFIPCQDSILEMTPTDFEKYSLRIMSEQLQNLDNCTFQHNKIIEVDDGNYQIDGYIEFIQDFYHTRKAVAILKLVLVADYNIVENTDQLMKNVNIRERLGVKEVLVQKVYQ